MHAPALLLLNLAVLLVTPSAGSYLRRARAYRGLASNQLTGLIPDSLGSLASLQYLCAPARALVVWHAESARRDAAMKPAAGGRELLWRCSCAFRFVTCRSRWLLPTPRWCKRRMLTENQFTGPIPDSLGSLSSLQYLCAPVS
jgi:hypothetical protein